MSSRGFDEVAGSGFHPSVDSRSGAMTANDTQTIARRMRAVIGLGVVLAAVAGCETQADYAPCGLDEEITSQGICTNDGSANAGTTSCVVKEHPHCMQSICLSYFGTPPFCSLGCSSDGDCPGSATCWSFSEQERYCVPKSREAQVAGS
jgi:hypothetical protein